MFLEISLILFIYFGIIRPIFIILEGISEAKRENDAAFAARREYIICETEKMQEHFNITHKHLMQFSEDKKKEQERALVHEHK